MSKEILLLVDALAREALEHYARIVKEKALLRNQVHVAQSVQQQAIEAEAPAA